jgi:transcription initiation factor TFIID subunit 7
MGEEEEDEMAAMLRAELGNLVTDSSPAAMSVGTPGAEAQAQADAYNALNNFAMAGGMEALPFEPASSPAYREYSGVEGGVGMRRLAEGVEEDDDSSDESDD